jgi:murein DD-endopeptidase MepM/ murein hydrolase activator NlpD
VKTAKPYDGFGCDRNFTQEYLNYDAVLYKDGDHRHHGVDYGIQEGTELHAVVGGKVIMAGFDPYGGGFVVKIQAPDGTQVIYMHMLSPLPVKAGDSIEAGSVIGKSDGCRDKNPPQCEVGHGDDAGHSTGPHLHFEVRKDLGNGYTHVSPMELLGCK